MSEKGQTPKINFDEFMSNPNIPIETRSLELDILKFKSEGDKQKARDVIDMFSRADLANKYMVAGAYAPMLVLISQMPFLTEKLSQTGMAIAAISIICLGVSGTWLLLFNLCFINIQRHRVEKYLCEFKDAPDYNVELNITKRRTIVIRMIFLVYLIGYGFLFYLVLALLLGF